MVRIGAIGAAAMAMAATPAWAQPEPLNLQLVCQGSGVLIVTESNDNGTIDVTDDEDTLKRSNVSGRIRLRFSPEEAAVKFPATMGGSPDKWEKLTRVKYDEEKITAEQRVLIWANKFVVDRRIGEIEISGPRFGYSGTCEKAPDEAQPKKF